MENHKIHYIDDYTCNLKLCIFHLYLSNYAKENCCFKILNVTSNNTHYELSERLCCKYLSGPVHQDFPVDL